MVNYFCLLKVKKIQSHRLPYGRHLQLRPENCLYKIAPNFIYQHNEPCKCKKDRRLETLKKGFQLSVNDFD